MTEELRGCIVDAALTFEMELAEPPATDAHQLGSLDRTVASIELARMSGDGMPILVAAADEIDPEHHPVAAGLLAAAILRTAFAGD